RPVYARVQDVTYAGPVFDQVDRFFNPGDSRRNAVNVAQNGGRTNWFMSFNNSTDGGVVLNGGGYTQNDVRLNLDHQLRSNVKLSFSGFHSRSNRADLSGNT